MNSLRPAHRKPSLSPGGIARATGRSLTAAALFLAGLLLCSHPDSADAAEPTLSLQGFAGTNVLLNSTGEPGSLHYLIRNPYLPFPSFDNAVAIQVLPTNGVANFTTPSFPNHNLFFKIKGLSLPPVAGSSNENSGIVILSAPEDMTVEVGGTFYFVVAAEPLGDTNAPLTYQWYTNDVAIPLATSPTFSKTNATTNDVAFYSCAITRSNEPPVFVRSKECNAPGGRLFVYENIYTNAARPGRLGQLSTVVATAIHGPNQPGGTVIDCGLGDNRNYVVFTNPNNPQTTWWARAIGTVSCKVVDISGLDPFYQPKVLARDGSGLCLSGASVVLFNTSPPPVLYQFAIYTTRGTLPLGQRLAIRVEWLK